MTISYNLNIPDRPNNPSVDQPRMKTNTNSISQIIGIDHVTFNTPPPGSNPNEKNGYHTVIHQTLQGSDPAAIVGINQIYSKNVTITNSGGTFTDTQLFARTGLGGIQQITGSSASANGFSFIAGVILQWGIVNAPLGSGTVTFNTAPNFTFPNAVFTIQLCPRNDGVHSAFTYYLDGLPTRFGFNYRGSTTGSNSLYWFAIGN
jgi:hypothetical protein